MPGLANSRWAPRSSSVPTSGRLSTTAAPSSALSSATAAGATASGHANGAAAYTNGSRSPGPAAELMRYAKIVRRLKWKLPYLAHGYRQATLRLDYPTDVDIAHRSEAELMFKLDFFEYYMLLERALVHLLGVFGITVSRDFAERHLRMMLEEQRQQDIRNYGVLRGNTNGTSRRREPSPWKNGSSNHRYHANVLEALDNAENPLHEALGTGEVRRQLGRAKDLRNRWKNVDDVEDASAVNGSSGGGSNTPQLANGKAATPLESYDLERILESIFEGFDRAFAVAERHVLEEQQAAAKAGDAVPMDWGSEEQQWEFMVDAMDWEAV